MKIQIEVNVFKSQMELRQCHFDVNLRKQFVVWTFRSKSRLTELEMIFTRDENSFNRWVFFHCIFPVDQLVVASLVKFIFVSNDVWESICAFTPRPNHVIYKTWL